MRQQKALLSTMSKEKLRRVFQEEKVAVSAAVEKLYPFLHGLRDHKIISQRMFMKLDHESKNVKTVSEVVYDLLSNLEKKEPDRIPTFLLELFNSLNLKSYPDLKEIQPRFSEFLAAGGPIQPTTREISGNTEQTPQSKMMSPPQKITQCSKKKVCFSLPKILHPQKKKVSPPEKARRVQKKDTNLQKVVSEKRKPLTKKRPSESNKMAVRRKSCTSEGVNFDSPELPVTCGDKNGILHKKKLTSGSGKPCIVADGRWFNPNDFQDYGGRTLSRNWKRSIYCSRFQLDKLFKLKYLKQRPDSTTIDNYYMPTRRIQTGALSQTDSTCLSQTPPPSTSHLQDGNSADHHTPSTSRYQSPSTSRNCSPVTEHHSPGCNFELSDHQKTLYSSEKFPVACGTFSGELYRNRFGTERRGKCIRMKTMWCTPAVFLSMDKEVEFISWDSDIRVLGVPLKVLVMQRYLNVHQNTCICEACTEGPSQENDDECAVCQDGGGLTCCDGCPRCFHQNCHVPTLPCSESSEKWFCTFCIMDRAPPPGPPVNQDLLKCEFLLLTVYCEDESTVFTDDPSIKVPGYTDHISHPMWLERVKKKLQNTRDIGSGSARGCPPTLDCYNTVERFVRDMRMIFDNYQSFNRDKEILQIGEKLRQVFENNLKKVFALTPMSIFLNKASIFML